MRRWAIRLTALAAAAYLLILGLLWAQQDALIFPGWVGPAAAQVEAVDGLTETVIPGDVLLRAWVRPADPGAPTLVVFHGNAGLQWRKLTAFAARGWGLVVPTYRGYAGNAGAPSEAGLIADGDATLAFARARRLTPAQIVLYGESLGTGVAARMATRPGHWRALVLDAPYTSVAGRAAELYPWLPVRQLIRHRFDTAAILPSIDAPVLVLHGTADRVIPIHHGRALAAAARDGTGVWIEDGTHYLPAARVAAEVAAFLGE